MIHLRNASAELKWARISTVDLMRQQFFDLVLHVGETIEFGIDPKANDTFLIDDDVGGMDVAVGVSNLIQVEDCGVRIINEWIRDSP